jgi:hypothetical protein
MSTNDTPATPETVEPVTAPSLPEDMLIVLPVRNLVMFPGVILPVAMALRTADSETPRCVA